MARVFVCVAASLVVGVLAVPACRSNEGALGRFPLWPPTYNMRDSTIIQPCNMSGFLNATHYSQFGAVSIDWSNAKQLWVQPPMSCEEKLVEQAALLKAARPGVRVMGYRNIVKALPWFSSTRAAMDDPSKQEWFLPFKPNISYHVPQCDDNFDPPKCSPLYHDQEQTPGYPHGDGDCPGPCDCGVHPCGEYLYNYLSPVPGLEQHLTDFILGPTGLGNANLSGFYLDDEYYNSSMYGPGGCSGSPVGGPTEEDPHCLDDMGHTGDVAWTTAMTDTWCGVRHRLFEAARLAGGWFWQMFSLQSTPAQPQCAAALRAMCAAGASSPFYNATTMHALTGDHVLLPNLAQDLAVFLLLRGPWAWLGFGWSGCNNLVSFPDAFALDYGVPTGFCQETAPNSSVFTRAWTKARAQMDCNTYVGTITML